MWKNFEIYSIKKISFGQKRPCLLRDFVPRGFFCNPGGGGSLIPQIASIVDYYIIVHPTIRFYTDIFVLCADHMVFGAPLRVTIAELNQCTVYSL